MKILLIVILLLVPRLSLAAVALDNSVSATNHGVATVTISNFTVSATSPLILCGTAMRFDDVTGVTYNSVSMTLLDTSSTAGLTGLKVWALKGQSGTHDVVVTFSSSADHFAVICASFTGVDQTTATGTTSTSTDWETSPVNMTVPSNGLSVDFATSINSTPACTYNETASGGTEIDEDCYDAGADSSTSIFSSYRSTSGTHGWTSPGGYLMQVGIPINAASAAGAQVTRRRFQ